jgi:hypothetical protein
LIEPPEGPEDPVPNPSKKQGNARKENDGADSCEKTLARREIGIPGRIGYFAESVP